MKKEEVDYVLVPFGLAVMLCYHLWLLHRILHRPATTVIGINAVNRRIWTRTMMEDSTKNGVLAVQTLRNNIMASTLLASMAITLSSLIAVLMTTTAGSRGRQEIKIVVGDTSEVGRSVKFFAILVCFLLAFLLNLQSIRYYSHASMLINVPAERQRPEGAELAVEYVAATVNRGGYFWSLGLRAFYFSFPLYLWVFGPIPMLCCCFLLVFMLYFLDVYTGHSHQQQQIIIEMERN
ncbi:uncharacterized protein LOC141822451 [Curcuma longa]|uniref:uncharacterized protein LOC141822451 n=1 Tax=Curcuma longa TaxID=136217 RepID=UPI003D9F6BD8